ncbi:MAG: leucine-rich repeat protein, partial [Eubacteriales bacterium]|nr:leucine-rich repeat protein [Eubacteriales bacterium]
VQESEKISKNAELIWNNQIKYIIEDNGEITITGPIDKNLTSCVIDKEIDGKLVTKIASNAFEDCSSLESIEIPDSLITIGDRAFGNCSSLKRIVIPNSVTTIGIYAFENCEQLLTVILPQNLMSIEYGTFSGCKALTSIDIPDTVTIIGERAFSYCESLTDIEIPDNVTTIQDRAFYNCTSLSNVKLPVNEKFMTIETHTFNGCSNLTGIEIPNNVRKIEHWAFANCTSLKDIDLKRVTRTGGAIFYNCNNLSNITMKNVAEINATTGHIKLEVFKDTSLEKIELPKLKNLDLDLFSGADNLKTVILGNKDVSISEPELGKTPFNSETTVYINRVEDPTGLDANKDGDGYTNWGAKEIIYLDDSRHPNHEEVVGPEDVAVSTVVKDLPSGTVTPNGGGNPKEITLGNQAIIPSGNMPELNQNGEIVFPDGTIITKPGALIESDGSIKPDGSVIIELPNGGVLKPNEATNGMFKYILTEDETAYIITGFNDGYTLPVGELEIPATLNDPLLGEKTVVGIGANAFENNSNITSISLPETLKNIGQFAFRNCDGLTILGDFKNLESIGREAFENCDNLETVGNFVNVGSIGNQAFLNCNKLITVGNFINVESINDSAFQGIDSLTKVGNFENVRRIGAMVFHGIDTLTTVGTFSNDKNEMIIEYGAFGNGGLKGDLILTGVKTIGEQAFADCESLTSVTAPDATSIEKFAFAYCVKDDNSTGLTSVIAKKATSIGSKAFIGCKLLTNVTIPEVTNIGSNAFVECDSLAELHLNGNVEFKGNIYGIEIPLIGEVFSGNTTVHIYREEEPDGRDKFKDGEFLDFDGEKIPYKNWGAKEVIYSGNDNENSGNNGGNNNENGGNNGGNGGTTTPPITGDGAIINPDNGGTTGVTTGGTTGGNT